MLYAKTMETNDFRLALSSRAALARDAKMLGAFPKNKTRERAWVEVEQSRRSAQLEQFSQGREPDFGESPSTRPGDDSELTGRQTSRPLK